MDHATSTAVGAVATPTLCPRCQKPLADPHGLGWCPGCGYCRSLDEDRARLPLDAAGKPTAAPFMPAVPAGPKPWWLLLLVGNLVLIAVGSWAAGKYLPFEPLQRAIWATAQLAGGLLLMFAAQAIALMQIAPEEATLNFTDAVIPFRIYGMIFKRLPRMSAVLCVCAWGLMFAACGPLLIGGMSHWLKYLPKSSEQKQK